LEEWRHQEKDEDHGVKVAHIPDLLQQKNKNNTQPHTMRQTLGPAQMSEQAEDSD
jgi:hypothetical protein